MKVPQQLIQELVGRHALDTEAFVAAHDLPAPSSIRLNPLKPVCPFLTGNEGGVPWSPNSYYLNVRPVFTADPLFHAGCYYVQEASSMFVAEAVRQTTDLSKNIIALDACAAPGGKSTLLASILNEESLLVSNEVISTRVPVLVQNLSKWGSINSLVTNNDPRDFSRLPGFFDLMVVDAPCSGSGLFRKQPDAVEHWSEENVHHCSVRQQRILHDLLPALKEDGILIYSTCSYSAEEDELICDILCKDGTLEPLQLKVPSEWGIVETKSEAGAFGYRFFPHLLKGEGFFLAAFRKRETAGAPAKVKKSMLDKISRDEAAHCAKWINSDKLQFARFREGIVAYKQHLHEPVEQITAALKVKKFPVEAGEVKGKDFIPASALAYQPIISSAIPRAELSEEDAMRFLRKQDFRLPEAEKGFLLATFKHFGIGWMKNLGTRINNYYPADWRILKSEF